MIAVFRAAETKLTCLVLASCHAAFRHSGVVSRVATVEFRANFVDTSQTNMLQPQVGEYLDIKPG